jgi:hypothetical protein
VHPLPRVAVLSAVVLGVLAASNPATAGPPLTNYECLRATTRVASEQLIAGLPRSDADRHLALRPVGKSAGYFLVENTLASALADAGWQVDTRADSISGRVLEFEVVDLGMQYVHSYRNAWFGEKRVVREARARLFGRLVDNQTRSIVWADQTEKRDRDEIPAAALPVLEDTNPPDYLKVTLPPQRWNKIVEPVVVTGIVVGLIFLFFSNQSTAK